MKMTIEQITQYFNQKNTKKLVKCLGEREEIRLKALEYLKKLDYKPKKLEQEVLFAIAENDINRAIEKINNSNILFPEEINKYPELKESLIKIWTAYGENDIQKLIDLWFNSAKKATTDYETNIKNSVLFMEDLFYSDTKQSFSFHVLEAAILNLKEAAYPILKKRVNSENFWGQKLSTIERALSLYIISIFNKEEDIVIFEEIIHSSTDKMKRAMQVLKLDMNAGQKYNLEMFYFALITLKLLSNIKSEKSVDIIYNSYDGLLKKWRSKINPIETNIHVYKEIHKTIVNALLDLESIAVKYLLPKYNQTEPIKKEIATRPGDDYHKILKYTHNEQAIKDAYKNEMGNEDFKKLKKIEVAQQGDLRDAYLTVKDLIIADFVSNAKLTESALDILDFFNKDIEKHKKLSLLALDNITENIKEKYHKVEDLKKNAEKLNVVKQINSELFKLFPNSKDKNKIFAIFTKYDLDDVYKYIEDNAEKEVLCKNWVNSRKLASLSGNEILNMLNESQSTEIISKACKKIKNSNNKKLIPDLIERLKQFKKPANLIPVLSTLTKLEAKEALLHTKQCFNMKDSVYGAAFKLHASFQDESVLDMVIEKLKSTKNTALKTELKQGLKLYDSPKAKEAVKKADRCFIATSVYGNPESYELQVLRNFRDEKLMPTFLGKIFVHTYYLISPPIARIIKHKSKLRIKIKKYLDKAIINIEKKYNI